MNKKNLFEIYHLAVHLQIADLEQLCLDFFTLKLTTGNLESQLYFRWGYQYLGSGFMERALKFQESGKPSLFYGCMYFMEIDEHKLKVKPTLSAMLKKSYPKKARSN